MKQKLTKHKQVHLINGNTTLTCYIRPTAVITHFMNTGSSSRWRELSSKASCSLQFNDGVSTLKPYPTPSHVYYYYYYVCPCAGMHVHSPAWASKWHRACPCAAVRIRRGFYPYTCWAQLAPSEKSGDSFLHFVYIPISGYNLASFFRRKIWYKLLSPEARILLSF